MKKKFILAILIGFFINMTSIHAKKIDTHDLQKLSANSLENKALKNGQNAVGGIFSLFFFLTIGLTGKTINLYKVNDESKKIYTLFTLSSLGTTIGTFAGWYKIVTERMKRYGYENRFWQFLFVDYMSHIGKKA